MTDDLADAQAAVQWAEAQLDIFEERLSTWLDEKPYAVVIQSNGGELPKIIKLAWIDDFPAIMNAEAGVIINSIRSSLDLLAASLTRRNGKTPSQETHFPIFKSLHDAIDPITGIEGKRWLSRTDRDAIKLLNPYPGGNDRLVALHSLDILRKHERLIRAFVRVDRITVTNSAIDAYGGVPHWIDAFQQESIVGWFGPDESEGDFHLPLQIEFSEGEFASGRPVVTLLRDFACLANSIIDLFDE